MDTNTRSTVDPDWEKVLSYDCTRNEQHLRLISMDSQRSFSFGKRRGARRLRSSLGLMCLLTALKGEGFEIQSPGLKEFSFGPYPPREIANVYGFSVLPSNYPNAVMAAKELKRWHSDKKITVIFGGPYASYRSREILLNQEAVDYIISDAGEAPLTTYLNGENPKNIAGFTYRDGDKIITNQSEFVPLRERLIPDYSFWPWLSDEKFAVVNTQEGCPVAVSKEGPCPFCCATHCSPNRRTIPQIIEIGKQLQSLGVTSIEEGGDDFTYGGLATLKYLDALIEAEKEAKLHFDRYIHASLKNLTYPGIMERLVALGVSTVQVGIEAGHPRLMLRAKSSPEELEEFIRLAQKYQIKIHASAIIGHEGETLETASRTLAMFDRLHETGLLFCIESEVFCPFPGTTAFDRLCEKMPELKDKDHLPSDFLMNAWLEHFTDLPWALACALRAEPERRLKPPTTGGMNL